MLLKDYLNELKKTKKLSWKDISELSGIPEDTVRSVFYGHTTDPRLSTAVNIVGALGGNMNALQKEHPEISETNPLEEMYEKRLRDKDDQIKILRKEKQRAITFLAILGTVILLLFIADILIGTRGWILYNK